MVIQAFCHTKTFVLLDRIVDHNPDTNIMCWGIVERAPLIGKKILRIEGDVFLEETENTQVTLFNDNGEDVIMMSGGANAATWAETGNSNLNWIENQNNISKVNFEVDATAVSQLFMNLDLRQAFANIETESLFRVVVNGTILQTYVADNASSYQNIELDLSAFVGNSLKVSLPLLRYFSISVQLWFELL